MSTYEQLVNRDGEAAAKAHMRTVGAANKKRRTTDSEAVFAAAEAARIIKPVLVVGVTLANEVTTFKPDDFGRINIANDMDGGYQRRRHDPDVNKLIAVMKLGGAIPDPIHLAERTDGTLWVVEGQQRFYAHEAVKQPLRALVHKVANHDAEERLFIVLNSKRKVTPSTIVKGWPGPAGALLRRLNEEPSSPVRSMIDFGSNHSRPLDAAVLARAILFVTSDVRGSGDTATALLPRLDAALRVHGRTAWAEAFIQLVAAVFGPSTGKGGRRVRALPLIALANVAHRRYVAAGRPIFPSSTAALRRVNWDTAVPALTRQWLPELESRIERLWKEKR